MTPDRVRNEYPPNYAELVRAFGDFKRYQAVFAYAPYIYNPFKREMTPDVLHHELMHIQQQSTFTSPEIWYNSYIHDPKFRLEQELLAYGEQFLFAKNNGVRGAMLEWLKEKLAFELSGEAYGRIISYQEAESKIRNYGKA